jgi:hypothetical protein
MIWFTTIDWTMKHGSHSDAQLNQTECTQLVSLMQGLPDQGWVREEMCTWFIEPGLH